MLDDDYLTAKEAAEYLSSTENSLRCMRCKGYGPPFHKASHAVFYRRSELAAYLAGLRPSDKTKRAQKGKASPGHDTR
jgi:hypothetical protein